MEGRTARPNGGGPAPSEGTRAQSIRYGVVPEQGLDKGSLIPGRECCSAPIDFVVRPLLAGTPTVERALAGWDGGCLPVLQGTSTHLMRWCAAPR